jgi:hypothetical protein
MLFAKFLLALPLFASAGLAAPAKKTDDLVDRATTVDPLSILNNLKSTVAVSAIQILPYIRCRIRAVLFRAFCPWGDG